MTQIIKEIYEAIRCQKKVAGTLDGEFWKVWMKNLVVTRPNRRVPKRGGYYSRLDVIYGVPKNIIDTQGGCRTFCQQQETTDWKQSLHEGASGFETNSVNIKLANINRRLNRSNFGISLEQQWTRINSFMIYTSSLI